MTNKRKNLVLLWFIVAAFSGFFTFLFISIHDEAERQMELKTECLKKGGEFYVIERNKSICIEGNDERFF